MLCQAKPNSCDQRENKGRMIVSDKERQKERVRLKERNEREKKREIKKKRGR